MDPVTIAHNFTAVQEQLDKAAQAARRQAEAVTLIAVSKQQQEERIDASLATGHRIFGENRVQEAKTRWTARKALYPDLCLHLIGPLQSNKTAEAVHLFDVIHTVDRPKIASAIAAEAAKQNKEIQCFIQLNTGEEPQNQVLRLMTWQIFWRFAVCKPACLSSG